MKFLSEFNDETKISYRVYGEHKQYPRSNHCYAGSFEVLDVALKRRDRSNEEDKDFIYRVEEHIELNRSYSRVLDIPAKHWPKTEDEPEIYENPWLIRLNWIKEKITKILNIWPI